MTDKMFSFITRRNGKPCTYNPLGGRCPHDCKYCWSMGSKGLVNRYKLKKYSGVPRLFTEDLLFGDFREGEFWFVCDMTDLFAWAVPDGCIRDVLSVLANYPKTMFLLLTKNPERYKQLAIYISENCVLGATIETNGWTNERGSFYGVMGDWISKAPSPHERIDAMTDITSSIWFGESHKSMVCIEPVLDFDYDVFLGALKMIDPSFVVIGYDNYRNHLPEPTLMKTQSLISELEKFTTVYRKTIRKAWNEK